MNDEDGKILTAIQVSLARIEQNLDNLTHRFRNMEQASQTFVTRREMEQMIEALSDRVEKLESRQESFTRALWGAWLAGLATVVGFGKKTGVF